MASLREREVHKALAEPAPPVLKEVVCTTVADQIREDLQPLERRASGRAETLRDRRHPVTRDAEKTGGAGRQAEAAGAASAAVCQLPRDHGRHLGGVR